jgi:hypothetical protein
VLIIGVLVWFLRVPSALPDEDTMTANPHRVKASSVTFALRENEEDTEADCWLEYRWLGEWQGQYHVLSSMSSLFRGQRND